MEIVRTIRAAAAHVARQSLRHHAARGVSVATIEVAVEHEEHHALVVTYHLASEAAAERKPVLFDCLPTPGLLTDIECDGADARVISLRDDPARAAIMEVMPRPGQSWAGLSLRFRVRYDACYPGSPDCFVLPDFLPTLITADERAHDQPDIRLIQTAPSVSVGYLRRLGDHGRMVQAVIFPSVIAHPHGSPGSGIVLNGRRFGGLRLGEVRRIERLTENILEFFSRKAKVNRVN